MSLRSKLAGALRKCLPGAQSKATYQSPECLAKMVRFYSTMLRSGDLVFDIGANVGNRTEAFLQIGCRVVAVEPQQSCADTIVKRFGEESRLVVEVLALGREPGEATLYSGKSSTIASMSQGWVESVKRSRRFGDHEWEKSRKVRVETLDELLERRGVPVFAKIDVEGYESEVLGGLSRPIPQIAFEFTPETLEEVEKCFSKLESVGSYVSNFSLGESLALEFPGWRTPAETLSALATFKGSNTVFGDIYAKLRTAL